MNNECPICYEVSHEWIILPCSHNCCKQCYIRLENKFNCFYCRQIIQFIQIKQNSCNLSFFHKLFQIFLDVKNWLNTPLYKRPSQFAEALRQQLEADESHLFTIQ